MEPLDGRSKGAHIPHTDPVVLELEYAHRASTKHVHQALDGDAVVPLGVDGDQIRTLDA